MANNKFGGSKLNLTASKQVSARRKMINSPWLTNAVKSVGLASKKVFEDLAPNLYQVSSASAKTVGDLVSVAKRSNAGNAQNALLNNKIIKDSKFILNAALEDLKSGKLYNEDRQMEVMMGDMGFDTGGFDFSDWGDADDSPDVNIQVNNSQSPQFASYAVDEFRRGNIANLKGQKALMDSFVAVSSANMLQQQEIGNQILSSLNNITSLLGATNEFMNTTLGTFIQNMTGYMERTGKFMEEQASNSNSYEPDLFSYNKGRSTINLAGYKEYVKKNAIKQFKNSNLGMFSDLAEGDMLKMLGSNPIGLMMQLGMTAAVPKDVKKSLADMDKVFGQWMTNNLIKLSGFGKGDYGIGGGLKQLLGKIFGIDTKRNKEGFDISGRLDNSSAVFDKVTRHTIVEIIPKYLRESTSYLEGIARAMGQNTQHLRGNAEVFDTKSGKYVRKRTYDKNFINDFNDNALREMNDSQMAQYLRRFNIKEDDTVGRGGKTNKDLGLTNKAYQEALDKILLELEKHGTANIIDTVNRALSNSPEALRRFTTKSFRSLMQKSGTGQVEFDDLLADLNIAKARATNARNSAIRKIENDPEASGYYKFNDSADKSNKTVDQLMDKKNEQIIYALTGNTSKNSSKAKGTLFDLVADIRYLLYNKYGMNDDIHGSGGAEEQAPSNPKPQRLTNSERRAINREAEASVEQSFHPYDIIEQEDSGPNGKVRNFFKAVVTGNGGMAMRSLLDDVTKKFGDLFEDGYNKFYGSFITPLKKEFFGQRDVEGYSRDGLFSSVQNSLLDGFRGLGHIITGKGYNNSKGERIDNSDDSIFGSVRSTFREVKDSVFSVFKAGIEGWSSALFGSEEDREKNKSLLDPKKVKDYMKKASPNAVIGASVGAATGMITGGSLLGALVGGPIGGAVLGTAIGFASKSEKFQDLVFGKIGEDGERRDGLIPKFVQDAFKGENGKKLKQGALGGAILGIGKATVLGQSGGLLGALVGGPLAGALVGAGVGIVTRSNMFHEFLFGDGNPDSWNKGIIPTIQGIWKKWTHNEKGEADGGKLLGMSGIGAGVGALTGAIVGKMGLLGAMASPFGPIGGALMGLALTMKASSGGFKEWLFGTTDENGNKHVGLLGKFGNMLNGAVFNPLRDQIELAIMDARNFIKYDILTPIQFALEPFAEGMRRVADSIHNAIDTITRPIKNMITNAANTVVDTVEKFIVNPIKKVTGTFFKAIGGLAKTVIGAPFRALEALAGGQNYMNKRASRKETMKQNRRDYGLLGGTLRNLGIRFHMGDSYEEASARFNESYEPTDWERRRNMAKEEGRRTKEAAKRYREQLKERRANEELIRRATGNRYTEDTFENRQLAQKLYEEYAATGSSRARKLKKFTSDGKLQFYGSDIQGNLKKEDILRKTAMGMGSLESLEYKEVSEQTGLLKNIKDIIEKKLTGKNSKTASADETKNAHPDTYDAENTNAKAAHDKDEIRKSARLAFAQKMQGKRRHKILDFLAGENIVNKLFGANAEYRFDEEGNRVDEEGNRLHGFAKGGLISRAIGGFKSLGEGVKVLVGEKGPEVAKLPFGTRIYNAYQTMTAAKKDNSEIENIHKRQIEANDADAIRERKKEEEEKQENKSRWETIIERVTGLLKGQTEHNSIWNTIFSKKGLLTAGALLIGSRILKFMNSDFGQFLGSVINTAKNAIGAPLKWFQETAWPFLSEKAFPWIKDKFTNAKKWVTETAWPWVTDTAVPWVKKKVGDTVDWLQDKVWPIIEPVITSIDNGIKHIMEHFGIRHGNLENQEGTVERVQDEVEDHLKLGTSILTGHPASAAMNYITQDGEITHESGARLKALAIPGFKAANVAVNTVKAGAKGATGVAGAIAKGAKGVANSKFAQVVTGAGKNFLFGNAAKKAELIAEGGRAVELGKDMMSAGLYSATYEAGENLLKEGTEQLAKAETMNGVVGVIKKAFTSLIDMIGAKLTGGGVADASSVIASKLGSYVDDIIKTIQSSGIYKKVSEKVAAISAATAGVASTGAGLVAILAKETTWIALGAVNGATGAKRLFEIDTQPDWIMIAISTAMGGLLGTTPGAIIDFIAQLISEVTGVDILHEIACIVYNLVAGQQKYDDLIANQEEFTKRWIEQVENDIKTQYEDYKKVSGEDISYEDYRAKVESGEIGVKTSSKANFNVQEHKTLGSSLGGGIVNAGKGIKNAWQNVFGKKSEVFTDPVTGQAWVKSPTVSGMYDVFKDPSGDLTPGAQNPNWIAMQSENQFDITKKANNFTSATVKQEGSLKRGAEAAGKWISDKASAAGNWISDKKAAFGNWASETYNAANEFIKSGLNTAGEKISSAIDIAKLAISGMEKSIQKIITNFKNKDYTVKAHFSTDVNMIPKDNPLYSLGDGLLTGVKYATFPIVAIRSTFNNIRNKIGEFINGYISAANQNSDIQSNVLDVAKTGDIGATLNYQDPAESQEGFFGGLAKVQTFFAKFAGVPVAAFTKAGNKIGEFIENIVSGFTQINDGINANDDAIHELAESGDISGVINYKAQEYDGPLSWVVKSNAFNSKLNAVPLAVFKALGTKVGEFVSANIDKVKDVGNIITTNWKNFGDIADTGELSNLWSAEDNSGDGVLGWIIKGTSFGMKLIKSPLAIFNKLGSTVANMINGAKEYGAGFKDAFTKYYNSAKAYMDPKSNIDLKALKFAEDSDPVTTLVGGVAKSVVDIYVSIVRKIRGMWEDFKDIPGNALDFVNDAATKLMNGGKGGRGYHGGYGNIDLPYYSQNDSRWSGMSYGNESMSDAGCGPTAMAMVASGLGMNTDPVSMAQYSRRHGFRDDTGTNWNFIDSASNASGLTATKQALPGSTFLRSNLSSGKPVILSGQGGAGTPYSSGGHYVVATGIHGNNVSISDPRGVSYSGEYPIEAVTSGANMGWGFSKTHGGSGNRRPRRNVGSRILSTLRGKIHGGRAAAANSTSTAARAKWVAIVRAVKKLYADKKLTYHADNSHNFEITLGGKTINCRPDCSGLVSAALNAFSGITGKLTSYDFTDKNNSTMKSTGFTALSWPGWESLHDGDIIAKNGHVEIFAKNEGGTHYVYNGGSTTSLRSADPTPSSKPSYTTVWSPDSATTSNSIDISDADLSTSGTTSGDSSSSSSSSTSGGLFSGDGILSKLGNFFTQFASKVWTGITTGEWNANYDLSSSDGSSSSSSSSDEITLTGSGNFPKYSLTDSQIMGLANIVDHEQGSTAGKYAEASQMANLTDKGGDDKATPENIVKKATGGWYYNGKNRFNNPGNPSSAAIQAVKDVIVGGKRTLPRYIDEHDCLSDIKSVTTNGRAIDKKARSSYEQHKTKIENNMGSTYTFYEFPGNDFSGHVDPFGYTSEALRSKYGDGHYTVEGTAVGITEESSDDTETTSSGTGATTAVSGDAMSNANKIFNYFRKKGLSTKAIAGILGNIESESGGDMSPMRVDYLLRERLNKLGGTHLQKYKDYGVDVSTKATMDKTYTKAVDSGKIPGSEFSSPLKGVNFNNKTTHQYGYGIAQMTTPEYKDQLLAEAKRRGVSISDIDAQMTILEKQLISTGVMDDLKKSDVTPQSAAISMLKKYEKPDNADSMTTLRGNRANKWYDKFKNVVQGARGGRGGLLGPWEKNFVSYGKESYPGGKARPIKGVNSTQNTPQLNLVNAARSQLGVIEVPENIQDYADATGASTGAEWAWCSSFVNWVFKKVLGEDEAAKALNYAYQKSGGKAAFRVAEMLEGFEKAGGFFTRLSGKKPMPGDLVIYRDNPGGKNHSHIGLVESYDSSTDKFRSVEGNTSPALSGFDRNGGMVAEKEWGVTSDADYQQNGLTGFARPDWATIYSDLGIQRGGQGGRGDWTKSYNRYAKTGSTRRQSKLTNVSRTQYNIHGGRGGQGDGWSAQFFYAIQERLDRLINVLSSIEGASISSAQKLDLLKNIHNTTTVVGGGRGNVAQPTVIYAGGNKDLILQNPGKSRSEQIAERIAIGF